MEEIIVKGGKAMRLGYTTGSCAAAAAKAAAATLLTGKIHDTVELLTPRGIKLTLEVTDFLVKEGSVSCAVRKDAGDDPDATDGINIYARVQTIGEGFLIDAGEGVGRVTRPGLACKVDEAAINPVPRKMIEENVSQTAAKFHYDGGFHITISAPGGEKIAKSTYNPRLGIVGGISILGTSGIVEPMSEAALIDTIKVEINSKFAGGADKLLITPGNYGRDFALNTFGLDLETGVKCSNYIGETLDYAVYKGFRQLLLIGHAGKLVKLAAGVMNTHSRVADCRSEVFATHAALAGAGAAQVKQLMESLTTEEMHRLLKSWGMSQVVWRSILAKMTARVNLRTGCRCQVEMVVFTIGDGILAQTENAAELAGEIRAMQAKV
jgi:cobalt-precorrin-5B (C1)-methyltransferase